LIEANFGAWQGHTHAEIDAQYPGARQAREAHKWHYVVPGVRATPSSMPAPGVGLARIQTSRPGDDRRNA
jgi:broad specificity phosphatase PhoE